MTPTELAAARQEDGKSITRQQICLAAGGVAAVFTRIRLGKQCPVVAQIIYRRGGRLQRILWHGEILGRRM